MICCHCLKHTIKLFTIMFKLNQITRVMVCANIVNFHTANLLLLEK